MDVNKTRSSLIEPHKTFKALANWNKSLCRVPEWPTQSKGKRQSGISQISSVQSTHSWLLRRWILVDDVFRAIKPSNGEWPLNKFIKQLIQRVVNFNKLFISAVARTFRINHKVVPLGHGSTGCHGLNPTLVSTFSFASAHGLCGLASCVWSQINELSSISIEILFCWSSD